MHAEFTDRALKDLRRLDVITQKQILKKLRYYLESPRPLSHAVKLINHKDGDYRFRVGVYRIIFDVRGQRISLLRIQHRRDVYRP